MEDNMLKLTKEWWIAIKELGGAVYEKKKKKTFLGMFVCNDDYYIKYCASGYCLSCFCGTGNFRKSGTKCW